MIDIKKAHLATDGNHVTLTMPISKVDAEKRIVSGFATLDNVDRQGDIVTAEASQKAFERFRGNVRLMHQPIPAGKVVNFRTDTFFDKESNKQYRGVYVDTYISKGAQDVWEMVLDGTLTGFSIGGAIKDFEKAYDAQSDSTVRVVKDYDLVELSLVDSPANQLANIFSIEKADKDGVAASIFNKSDIQNVFWCETDQLAYTDFAETRDCLVCEKDLSPVGWLDIVDGEDMEKAMWDMINTFTKADGVVTNEDTPNKYPKQDSGTVETEELAAKPEINDKPLNKAGKFSTGDFVQWNSSGGTARGRVTRVVTRGKINVPNSSVTVTGTEEDPAVVIEVYRQDAKGQWRPSGVRVGHKMKTLRAWATKVVKSLSDVKDDKEKATKPVAQPIIKGGVEVAENTEITEAVEEAVEETVETPVEEAVEETLEKSDEVVETVDEVVEEAETAAEEVPAVEESAEEPADASTEDGEAAGEDIAKALDGIKAFITESFEKSAETSNANIATVASSIAEVAKATAEKHEQLNKALAEVQEALASLNNRVESVESDTAVRKSSEVENLAQPQTTTMKKSLWGGRFLGSAEIFE
jgi:chemotaxis protein histidine kinase CheA